MRLMPSPVNKTMRQGQQYRRGGGRDRKPQNALTRHYESNGPDVKLRGTAAQIAQKYLSLARDALASGDMVAAESYFQHAEHYNRIIMAAQSQFGPQHGNQPGEGGNGGFRPRWNADGSSDDDGSDDDVNEGGGDIRGGGGQDRERHQGDREHHGGGRDRGRQGGNGREAGRDTNGSDPSDAVQPDDSASDPVG